MSSLKLISTSVLTVFVIAAMAACDQTDTTRQIGTVSSEQSIVQLAKPTPQQAAWQDLEIGMFIHFGLWTWPIGVTEDLKTLADVQKNFNQFQKRSIAEQFFFFVENKIAKI